MGITFILVLTSLTAILYLLFKKSEAEKFLCSFPGPAVLPVIGCLGYLRKVEDRLANLMRLQKEFGNRVASKGGILKILVLFHPDDVGKVLHCKDANKSMLYNILFGSWMERSLFIAKSKQHTPMRKAIQHFYNFKDITNYESRCNEHCKNLVNVLKGKGTNGQEVQIRWILPLFALDLMFQYFADVKSEFLSRLEPEYAQAFHDETRFGFQRLWSPWLWPDIFWKMTSVYKKEKATRKILQDYMEKIVRDRKKQIISVKASDGSLSLKPEYFPDNDVERRDKLYLLDYFISEEYFGRITEKYIIDEMTGVLFGGHDTISSVLTFCLYVLGSHPKEQAKVHLEMDEIFGDDKNRNVDFSDLANLKYLECCIKEVLRLYPSVAIIARAPVNGCQLDKATTIPGSVEAMLSPWVTHRLPEFWPEPEEFKPSRFFPENCVGRHPYCYFPFTLGPRSCAGQKFAFVILKTALAHIFRNFTVELEEGAKPMIPMAEVVMFPKGGLKVRLTCR